MYVIGIRKRENDEYVNPGNIFVTLSLKKSIKNQYAEYCKKGPRCKNKSVLVVFIIYYPQGDDGNYMVIIIMPEILIQSFLRILRIYRSCVGIAQFKAMGNRFLQVLVN